MREDFKETLFTSPVFHFMDFWKEFILFESDHSPANARDAAPTGAGAYVDRIVPRSTLDVLTT